MKKKIQKLVTAIVATILLLIPVQVTAAAAVPDNYHENQLNLNVKSAIAIDANSSQLLYGKNINQPLPIASMTKIITAYLTLKAVKDQKISWDTKVKPTENIVKVADNKRFSNVPLKMEHSYTVRQLYQATLIESANGAAMMLAEAISGSQLTFVRQMRKQLKKWGIDDAQIYTVCGLPNKSMGTDAYPNIDANAENTMSAKDMAIVGQHLINEFPEVIRTTKIARLNFVDQDVVTPMTNFNWMLKGLSQYHENFKVDGLKTGTTDKAGACFIGTAKHNGARIITIVMGARHANSNDPARFEATSTLLKFVYQNYRTLVLSQNEAIIGTTLINVHNGSNKKVNIGIKKDYNIWIPVTSQKLRIGLVNNMVEAPVAKGQQVGYYYIKSGSTNLISLQSTNGIRLPAKALQSSQKVNIFVRFWRWLFGG